MRRASGQAVTAQGAKLPHSGSGELGFLDQLPVGLAVYGSDGVLAHGNPWFARRFHERELPSRTRSGGQWQGWQDDGRTIANGEFPCERALRGETVSPGVDLLHLGDDGVGRWFNVSATPIVDPDGATIVGVVLLFLACEGKRRAEAIADAAARRFRQFADDCSAGIWIADATTQAFSYRNSGHGALHGGGAPAVATLADWLALVDDADRAAVHDRYAQVLDGRSVQHEYRLAATATARSRHLRETSFAIRDEDGAVTMIGGIAEDVTPKRVECLFMVGRLAGDTPAAIAIRADGGYRVKEFGSVREFSDVAGFVAPGCVIVDLSAVEEQPEELALLLAEHGASRPIVIVGRPGTGVAPAVAAMRAGAADYLLPPFDDFGLVATMERAVARAKRPGGEAPDHAGDRLAGLSQREREVFNGLRAGGTNKSIARDLGISPRTVEAHRGKLMERMNAKSLAQLLQAAA